MLRRFATLLLLGVSACGSLDESSEPREQPPVVLPGARGGPVEIVTSRELEDVARLMAGTPGADPLAGSA